MRKADSLRDWLLRSVTGLSGSPERLHVFVSDGAIDFARGSSLSFGYRYRLTIVIRDFAQGLDQLMVPLVIWCAENEPALIDQSQNLGFDCDIVDDSRSDIEIRLELREPVVVRSDPENPDGFIAEHPDPQPFPDRFEGVGEALLSDLWLDEFGTDRFLAATRRAS
ncbi:phage tail protein [Novosphingopyxis sp. YJ-S2-01]|uniref:phage tail protein n=1 Tax=Novosphingopyxis sp. YJ-S2-01 TaxID=2794021 RepID=UPI0018DDE5F0|nr:phage tail protein [Novosphingopyxis sp. YJ-S2-01]MBH9537892.1 phage tail protein [Novosphingopyxis sp. YJ-S2-01]